MGWLEVSFHPSLRGLCSRASEGSFSRLFLQALVLSALEMISCYWTLRSCWWGRGKAYTPWSSPSDSCGGCTARSQERGLPRNLPSGVFQGSLLIPAQSELLPLPPGQRTCAFLPLLFSSPASVGLQLCIESEFCCLFPGGFRLLLHRQTGRRMFPTQATAPRSQASQEGGLP